MTTELIEIKVGGPSQRAVAAAVAELSRVLRPRRVSRYIIGPQGVHCFVDVLLEVPG